MIIASGSAFADGNPFTHSSASWHDRHECRNRLLHPYLYNQLVYGFRLFNRLSAAVRFPGKTSSACLAISLQTHCASPCVHTIILRLVPLGFRMQSRICDGDFFPAGNKQVNIRISEMRFKQRLRLVAGLIVKAVDEDPLPIDYRFPFRQSFRPQP